MCAVAKLFEASQWGLLCSSGQTGAKLFAHLVESELVPLSTWAITSCGDDVRFPLQSITTPTESLYVSLGAMSTRGHPDAYTTLEGQVLLGSGEVIEEWIPQCRSLTVTGADDVMEIVENFMVYSPTLESAKLLGSSILYESPDAILSQNQKLTDVDLTFLGDVTTVGRWLLSGCIALKTVNLSPLVNVTVIRGGFLSGCRGLTDIDLTVFSNVTEVGGTFLNDCSSLCSLDLSPFAKVKSVGPSFIGSCPSLEEMDLTPMVSLERIDLSFMESCSGLTTIDLAPLKGLTCIPEGFLRGCTSLDPTTLDLTPVSTLPGFTEAVRLDIF